MILHRHYATEALSTVPLVIRCMAGVVIVRGDRICSSDKNDREWTAVKGSELLRLLRRLARRRDWAFDWRPDLGKGSHGRLLVNGRRTVIPDLKRELKTGTLISILKDLSIGRDELDRN